MLTPRNVSTRNPRRGSRQSEPAHWLPNAAGGLTFVPRRAVDTGLLTTREGLLRAAGETPLRLLTYLVDVEPTLGFAVWTALRLTAPEGGLKIVAVKAGGAEDEQDDEGTALLTDLWQNQPPEVGGLSGLQGTLTLSVLLTGLTMLEAVPGRSGEGVRRLWPVDSLTVRFDREGDDLDAVPYQLQRYPNAQATRGNYVKLNTDLLTWRLVDNLPDDLYGRAPMATALGECLRMLAMMQDLTNAIHNAGTPRLAVGFNFKETYEIAKLFGMDDPKEAEGWVQDQFKATIEEFNKLNPGENIHYDSNGNIVVIEGAKGLSALAAILEFLRQRLTQAVKSLPTLLGINDGSTQTYTSVEWAIYAQGLEGIRAKVVDLLLWAANLHLRLLGKPLVAKAVYEPIRTTDAQQDANTEAIRIKNAAEKRRQGWVTKDQAAQEVTGSDAVADPPDDSGEDPKAQDPPPAGTTDEERGRNNPADRQPATDEEEDGGEE